jgi:hypothetical protein
VGPKFSAKERKQLNLSRFYAITQIGAFRAYSLCDLPPLRASNSKALASYRLIPKRFPPAPAG